MSVEDPDPKGLIPMPKGITKDRITLVLNLYHEHAGDETKERACQVWKELESKDIESYTRRVTAKPEWKPLDLGWVEPEDVGLILIENLAGKGTHVNPTEEEKEETKKQLLEIGSESCSLVVSPGWPQFFNPRDVSGWKVRSLHTEFKYRITIFPK